MTGTRKSVRSGCDGSYVKTYMNAIATTPSATIAPSRTTRRARGGSLTRVLTASAIAEIAKTTMVAQAHWTKPDGMSDVATTTIATARTSSRTAARTGPGRLGVIAFLDSLPRPRGCLGQQLVVPAEVRQELLDIFGTARVPERDDRVPLEPPSIVARDVQAVVPLDELVIRRTQPVDQRHAGLRTRRLRQVAAAFLDAAVPRADVLTDVAAVDAIFERGPVREGDRPRRLRPVREALRRVERPRLVERAG